MYYIERVFTMKFRADLSDCLCARKYTGAKIDSEKIYRVSPVKIHHRSFFERVMQMIRHIFC